MFCVLEQVFNIIFFVEMLLKIFCLKGFLNYITPYANRFDFMIVLSSVVQIIVNAALSTEEANKLSVLKLFRLFRAFRVARLLRRFESVKMIVDSALGSMQPIFNIMMFMILMIIVYGCLGMQLYGNQVRIPNFPHPDPNPDPASDEFRGGRRSRAAEDKLRRLHKRLFQPLSGLDWLRVGVGHV